MHKIRPKACHRKNVIFPVLFSFRATILELCHRYSNNNTHTKYSSDTLICCIGRFVWIKFNLIWTIILFYGNYITYLLQIIVQRVDPINKTIIWHSLPSYSSTAILVCPNKNSFLFDHCWNSSILVAKILILLNTLYV